METTILFILLLLFYILFLLLLNKIKKPKALQAFKLPPGPPKLPFIGNLHHLFGEHPHRRLLSLANKYGPLLYLKLGEVNYIVITSPKYAREVMRIHDIDFASRPEILATKIIFYESTNIAFSPYGKYWSQLRKTCATELLSNKRVESFGFIREEEGENMVKKIHMAEGLLVNLSEMLISLTNRTISRASFGKGCSHEKKFKKAMKTAIQYLSGFNFVDFYPSLSLLSDLTGFKARLKSVHQELDDILEEIFDDHRAKNLNEDFAHEDILDILFRLKNHDKLDIPLTVENIKAVILDLFMAGTETLSSSLEWAMSELIRHPDILKKVQLEVRKVFEGKKKIDNKEVNKLPYLNQIIKETLRLHSTVPLLVPRISCNTVEVGDITIPVGSRILINAWAIMRDPTYWVDPESFRPERFDEATFDFKALEFAYLPFGAGRRMCPGKTFATSGIECWLAQLLFHFDWKLPDGKKPEELDMEEAVGLTISRQNDLVLLATPHKQSPSIK